MRGIPKAFDTAWPTYLTGNESLLIDFRRDVEALK